MHSKKENKFMLLASCSCGLGFILLVVGSVLSNDFLAILGVVLIILSFIFTIISNKHTDNFKEKIFK